MLGLIRPDGTERQLFNVVWRFFVRPDAGEITWQGERGLRRIRPDRLARLGIARTLQGLGLFAHLPVLANVMVGADRHARAGASRRPSFGLPSSDRDERGQIRGRALATLAKLRIADVAGRPAAGLPFGIQKRVEMARALVAGPKLLILDEPACGLTRRGRGPR